MNIETARAIIADNSLAPSQADWMIAGRVLYDHWQKHPELLKPARGTLTHDAPRKETSADTLASIRALRVRIDRLVARKGKQTRDQGTARKLLRLDAPASVYRVTTDPDGTVWLERLEGAQTGKRPPAASPDLMEADPALKMGETMMGEPWPIGDAVARHKRATAARNAGAAFAAQFNTAQRARWGQS